ncbi:MAG: choice-of-anchor B family protein [Chitinophagales bacterium]
MNKKEDFYKVKLTQLIKLLSVCLVAIASFAPNVQAQNNNITFRSQLTYSSEMSDIWGYAVDGNEYALVTTEDETSIVNVTNPDNPIEVFNVAGPNTFWRDPKTHGTFAYITNEAGGGLQIIDMSALPNGNITNDDVSYWTGGNYQGSNVSFSTAHNIFVDEFGVGYIVGANYGVGGMIIVDLVANPTNPPILGIYNERYVHDIYVRDNIAWAAEINNGVFSVVEVSDKNNPLVLAIENTSSGASHNIWLSDDGNYVFTTDEVNNANIDAFDVSDLGDIQETDRFQSSPGSNVMPHNVFVYGNFLTISYYRDGAVIADATYPNKIIEVGNYDTSPNFSGGGFNGCWGVYPYLPSGNLLATDIEEGLYVLTPTYQGACFLQGNITDGNTGAAISNANITINENSSGNTTSEFGGSYLTGVADAGTYTVTIEKAGYYSQTVAVNLTNGTTETLNIALTMPVPVTITGQINEQGGSGISDAVLFFINNGNITSVQTNTSGAFSTSMIGENTLYDIFVGKWGYISQVAENVTFDNNNTTIDFTLQSGYYDDFTLDFGWTINGDATAGIWERDIPFGTSNNGFFSNPNVDSNSDLGDYCYVTGNAESNSAGTDDVDGGSTILTSPIFDLTSYDNAEISYERWFANSGGDTTADDELLIKLTNGSTTVTVETINSNDANLSQWVASSILVNDFITPTANMQLIVETGDLGNGHLVEAGLDKLEIADVTVANPVVIIGQVIDENNQAIPFAEVLVSNSNTNVELTSDANGNFSTTVSQAANYDVFAGKWGFQTAVLADNFYDSNSANVTLLLETGYTDDFVFDFGWTVNSNATAGIWERAVPYGTFFNSEIINADTDSSNDLGEQCFVTGNAFSDSAGTDDVDAAETTLTSPIFDLSSYNDPQLSYERWFLNTSGNGAPDDELTIELSNGITTVLIESVVDGDAFESQWYENTIRVSDYITPTANMQMTIETADFGEGHLVEAGFDNFKVTDLITTPEFIVVQMKANLSGCYNTNSGLMTTVLRDKDFIPTTQPYNRSPWNYEGTESVASANDIPTNVVDWVLVEIRDAANSNIIIESRAAFLLNDGSVQDLDGTTGIKLYDTPQNMDYVIVFRHRNHIALASNFIVTLPNNTPYDFTQTANVLEGTSQLTEMSDNTYACISGDFDSNGIISVFDFNYYAAESSFINVYTDGDATLDGHVTIADFNAYLPSLSKIGVSLIRY